MHASHEIDLNRDDWEPVSGIPALLPNRPHVATVWRWIKKGSHGIKLRTVKIGGRRYVSKADLNDFIAAVTAAADGQTAPPSEATAERRRRVDARLAAAGL